MMPQGLDITDADFDAMERELCSRSMADFVRLAWPHVIPDKLQWNWHIEAICDHLDAVSRGEINRLLINIPPGTSKSTLVGVMYPAWLWGPGNQPWHRYIGAAHEQSLAIRDNRSMRELIRSDWFQRLWPLGLMGDQNEKLYFENEKRGFRQACAVASMTGRRGHTIVWDDPLAPEKAAQPLARDTAIRILSETLPTRLNDPTTSSIIIIMQRLHEGDPSGHILSNDLGYEHLLIPMEFEPERRVTTSIGWTDPRTEDGELLDAVRFPPEVIERDKKAMGSYAWAGQMQQRPAPRDGGMFQETDFLITERPPRETEIIQSIRAWDKAGSDGSGDYTVGVLMHRLKDGQYVIADVVRGQWSALKREETIKQTAQIDGNRVKVFVEQEPGSSGKDSAAATVRNLAGFIITAERATGDKIFRAETYSAQVEAGNVLLVRGLWNRPFLEEHGVFPFGKNDDQVDAAAHAFNQLVNKTGWISSINSM